MTFFRILFLFFLIFPIHLEAQTIGDYEVTAEGHGYFYVTVNGDTVSQHTLIQEAVVTGINQLQFFPDADVNIVQSLISHIERTSPPIRNINWGISNVSSQDDWKFNFQFDTSADTSWIEGRCIGSSGVENYSFGVPLVKEHASGVHYFSCDQVLEFNIVAEESGELYSVEELIDLKN